MRIATWNVNGVKGRMPRFPALAHGQRSHHGVAVLTRAGNAVEVRRGLPGNDEDTRARYLECDVGELRIASVYVPNGNPVPSPNFDYKLDWTQRFLLHAAKLFRRGKTILAGDFNVVPTNIDIYNAGTWRHDAVLQPETRALWTRFMAQGWIDVTREHHRGERIYTFWVNEAAYRRNAGFRMDFLLVTPDIYPRVRAEGIDHAWRALEKPSDHAPVWLDLD